MRSTVLVASTEHRHMHDPRMRFLFPILKSCIMGVKLDGQKRNHKRTIVSQAYIVHHTPYTLLCATEGALISKVVHSARAPSLQLAKFPQRPRGKLRIVPSAASEAPCLYFLTDVPARFHSGLLQTVQLVAPPC